MTTPVPEIALSPDEKTAPVMLYTAAGLARGLLVLKSTLRANIWLRTAAVGEFIRLLNTHVMTFGGGSSQTTTFREYFVPAAQVIACHPVPPSNEPLDYEENEANRKMEAVTALVGTFRFHGLIRISSHIPLSNNLDIMHSEFLSLYQVEIGNSFLAGTGMLQAPMALIRPRAVHFGVK